MSQIFDPVPNDEGDRVLCSYINATSQIQIARITNVTNWYFERVVFPGQRLVFEAVAYGILEIHSGMMASAILSDRIPCQRLAIEDSQDTSKKKDLSIPKISEAVPPKKQPQKANHSTVKV